MSDRTASYFEPSPREPFEPEVVVRACIESGTGALLLDADAMPDEFFDLSSGVAGELLHRLSVYRLRLAGVVADPTRHSTTFQDFVREVNRGRPFRFFATRTEAVAWLTR